MTASVALGPEIDMQAVATAAGNPTVSARWYRDGRLYLQGVSQEALERAAALVQGLPVPPASGTLWKSDFVLRLSPGEADRCAAMLNDASSQMALFFDSVASFEASHPLYPMLRAALATEFGEARTAELLAPS